VFKQREHEKRKGETATSGARLGQTGKRILYHDSLRSVGAGSEEESALDLEAPPKETASKIQLTILAKSEGGKKDQTIFPPRARSGTKGRRSACANGRIDKRRSLVLRGAKSPEGARERHKELGDL